VVNESAWECVQSLRLHRQCFLPHPEGVLSLWKKLLARSISKDNVTTCYGKTVESRIIDPADGTRVFSWLICESYGDKGNVIVYQYKPENSYGVDETQVHERNGNDSSSPPPVST
jgi:virulence plasmid B protein